MTGYKSPSVLKKEVPGKCATMWEGVVSQIPDFEEWVTEGTINDVGHFWQIVLLFREEYAEQYIDVQSRR
jgi:hypothetical protein